VTGSPELQRRGLLRGERRLFGVIRRPRGRRKGEKTGRMGWGGWAIPSNHHHIPHAASCPRPSHALCIALDVSP